MLKLIIFCIVTKTNPNIMVKFQTDRTKICVKNKAEEKEKENTQHAD
jgi:hypothetical protein